MIVLVKVQLSTSPHPAVLGRVRYRFDAHQAKVTCLIKDAWAKFLTTGANPNDFIDYLIAHDDRFLRGEDDVEVVVCTE